MDEDILLKQLIEEKTPWKEIVGTFDMAYPYKQWKAPQLQMRWKRFKEKNGWSSHIEHQDQELGYPRDGDNYDPLPDYQRDTQRHASIGQPGHVAGMTGQSSEQQSRTRLCRRGRDQVRSTRQINATSPILDSDLTYPSSLPRKIRALNAVPA